MWQSRYESHLQLQNVCSYTSKVQLYEDQLQLYVKAGDEHRMTIRQAKAGDEYPIIICTYAGEYHGPDIFFLIAWAFNVRVPTFNVRVSCSRKNTFFFFFRVLIFLILIFLFFCVLSSRRKAELPFKVNKLRGKRAASAQEKRNPLISFAFAPFPASARQFPPKRRRENSETPIKIGCKPLTKPESRVCQSELRTVGCKNTQTESARSRAEHSVGTKTPKVLRKKAYDNAFISYL